MASLFNVSDRVSWLEEVGSSEAEVRAEGVDVHRSAHVDSLENSGTDSFIETVDNNLKSSEAPELEDGNFTEDCSECNQNSACTEITDDQRGDVEANFVELLVNQEHVPEAGDEDGDLEHVGGDEHVEAD